MTRIYVFVLILNLIFPVLGYTFTAFGESPQDYEADLDPDSLMKIGINLVDAESHNFTYLGGYQYYTLLNVSIRAEWRTYGIIFQKQSSISKAFNSWLFPYRLELKSIMTNEYMDHIPNATIVMEFNTDFNWTRFVLRDGHHLFITPFANDGNISKAVYDDGHINMTIAKSFEDDTTFNFGRFLGWYSSILVGDQTWGLPSIFSWFVRILGALSVFAVVMLTKELIRL